MNISEQAAIEFKKVLDGFEKPGAGIHIFSSQGCCGPAIQMDVAFQPNPNETVVTLENIDFFVEKELLSTLENVTIERGPNGFRLQGMNSGSGCCG